MPDDGRPGRRGGDRVAPPEDIGLGRRPARPWEPDRRPGRRLFVAVPLPDVQRAAVAELVERVRTAEPGGEVPRSGRPELRWVRLDGLHLTLRFLGPTPEVHLPGLRDAVRRVAGGLRPFRIRVSGGGAFPGLDRPRALWLGVVEGRDDLAGAATQLDEALAPLGWPPADRPFRAHLTVARADGQPAAGVAARRLVADAAELDVAWDAERIVLFESHTGGGPARYEALEVAALGTGPATT